VRMRVEPINRRVARVMVRSTSAMWERGQEKEHVFELGKRERHGGAKLATASQRLVNEPGAQGHERRPRT